MEEVNNDRFVLMKVPTPGLTGIAHMRTRSSIESRLVKSRLIPVWTTAGVFIVEQLEESTHEFLCVVLIISGKLGSALNQCVSKGTWRERRQFSSFQLGRVP